MLKRFSILHLLFVVMSVCVLLSWFHAFRRPQVQDGYIWDETRLVFELPAIPPAFRIEEPIKFRALVNHSYRNGAEMYVKHYYQGWWNCRKDFFEQNENFPYREELFAHIESSADALPPNDFRMHPMIAKRDGYRDCSNQIEALVDETSVEEFRRSLIQPIIPRILTPLIATACLLSLGILFWHRNRQRCITIRF
jgi:hypothetical protein